MGRRGQGDGGESEAKGRAGLEAESGDSTGSSMMRACQMSPALLTRHSVALPPPRPPERLRVRRGERLRESRRGERLSLEPVKDRRGGRQVGGRGGGQGGECVKRRGDSAGAESLRAGWEKSSEAAALGG